MVRTARHIQNNFVVLLLEPIIRSYHYDCQKNVKNKINTLILDKVGRSLVQRRSKMEATSASGNVYMPVDYLARSRSK